MEQRWYRLNFATAYLALNSVDRNLLRSGNARPRVQTVRVDIVSFAGLLYPCDENSFAVRIILLRMEKL